MPGYGVSADDAGMLPWSWAVHRLVGAHTYWLSTTRPDGRPHAMAVWGSWSNDTFVFSTGRSSQKARNLASQSACVVSTSEGTNAVVVEGVAAPATDEQARAFAADCEAKYGMAPPPGEPTFVVQPQVAFGFVDDESFPTTATRWRFDR